MVTISANAKLQTCRPYTPQINSKRDKRLPAASPIFSVKFPHSTSSKLRASTVEFSCYSHQCVLPRPVARRQANQAVAWGPELARGPKTTTGFEQNATTNCVSAPLIVNAVKCNDTVIGIPLEGAPLGH